MTSVAEVLNKSGITSNEWEDMKNLFLSNQCEDRSSRVAETLDTNTREEVADLAYNGDGYAATSRGNILPFRPNNQPNADNARSGYNVVSNLKSDGVPLNAGTPAFQSREIIDEIRNNCMASDSHSAQADDTSTYRPHTTSSQGRNIDYQVELDAVNYDGYMQGDTEKDLDSVRFLISNYIRKKYGFTNIKSIIIRDGSLIINNKLCIPKLSRKVLETLPLDCKDYVVNGSIGYLFDFYNLTMMSNLTLLDIDSLEFTNNYILPDLGWGNSSKPFDVLLKNTKAKTIIIAGETATKDVGVSPEAQSRIERKARLKQIHQKIVEDDKNLFKGFYKAGDDWRKWQWQTVSKFANNRGKKGFLKYSFGLVGRIGLALAVTPLTYAPRGVRAICSTLQYAYECNQDKKENR